MEYVPMQMRDLRPEDQDLVRKAADAIRRAYAPYSGFGVGSAVRTKSGKVFTAANMENASYGVTICAETGALSRAVAEGDFNVECIAVVGRLISVESDNDSIVTPCGRCRQLILEAAHVADTDVTVICCNADLTKIVRVTIDDLMPMGFGPKNLGAAE